LNINERIKQLRKEAGWNQKEFASRLGITQSGVSYMEQAGSTVAESTIKAICSICNLSENWLRNGIEPKNIETNAFSLDNFINERGGTDLEKEIIKTYFELDPEVRKAIFDHFKNKFFPRPKRNPLFDDIPDTPEELEKMYPVIDMKNKKDIG
jgi:transcriptional regulator with XRE-family HTH domain